MSRKNEPDLDEQTRDQLLKVIDYWKGECDKLKAMRVADDFNYVMLQQKYENLKEKVKQLLESKKYHPDGSKRTLTKDGEII